ncbi:hypothetical protein [Bradyrhizobium sp. 45]|uniref:hypothetical protein n=1 Tax=Bradyrhizobium sp. 45 TaxID=1043587 RepID=UPI001FFA9165|nr:hypothetical protein [Bradyrhizobium sp. 45]MCK1306209.1 hypothetical protein [Bradyrhizobium sp. 45]
MDNQLFSAQTMLMRGQRNQRLVLRFKNVLRRREPHGRPWYRQLDIPAWLNAVFTLTLAIFAYEAWEESRRAREIFQGQLTAAQDQIAAARDAQRAWLTVATKLLTGFKRIALEMGPSKPTFEGYELSLGYQTKNVGHLPAQAVLIGSSWIVPKPGGDYPMDELYKQQKETCTRPSTQATDSQSVVATTRGTTIFPDEEPSQNYGTIRIGLGGWPTKPFSTDSYVLLVGCVMYRTGGTKTDHHTAFAYKIEAIDGQMFSLPTDPAKIALENMRLSRLRFTELNSAD